MDVEERNILTQALLCSKGGSCHYYCKSNLGKKHYFASIILDFLLWIIREYLQ